MNIIDGYNGGVAHISADMIRDHNISLYGTGDYILPVGNKFAAEIVNNNTVRIKDGLASIGGARVSIGYGQSENVTITNGTSGYKRNDLIVIEYNKDNVTLKETATLKVVKGALSSGTPSDPALVTGDIRAGASKHQAALARVSINGLSITKVETIMGTGAGFDVEKDYIVERNSGNGYEWRKWASGNAEYWAYGSTTVVQYASWNGWASYQLPLNFVGNIFNTAPHICGAHIYIGSGFSCVSDTGNNTTATGTTFYVLGSATGTQPVKYSIYVKGTWK